MQFGKWQIRRRTKAIDSSTLGEESKAGQRRRSEEVARQTQLLETRQAELRKKRDSARQENARFLESGPGSLAEARQCFDRYREVDPFPEIPPALLNVGDLTDYLVATGMVFPVHAKNLKSASLRIPIQGEFTYADANGSIVRGWLLPRDHPDFERHGAVDTFKLEGNTIAFLTLEPWFQIPDYMAMRFNLTIDHVYKGLLLGTGPMVDPGYCGKLHIPLHNLTSRDYQFKAGEGLIWAEFTKISPIFSDTSGKAPTRGGRFMPFVYYGNELASLEHFLEEAVGRGVVPRSSAPEALRVATRAQKQSQKTAKGFRRVSVVAIFSFIAAVVAVVIPTVQVSNSLSNQVGTLLVRIHELESQVADLQRPPESNVETEEVRGGG